MAVYYVQFNNVTVSQAQDLFELVAASNKPIELVSATITVDSDETNQQLKCSVQRRTGAYTSGSAGSTPTVQKRATGDPTPGVSAEANNTTRASGGTQEILHMEGWPSQGGWSFVPVPGAEPKAINGELLIVGLEVAPGSGIAMSGTVVVREL